MWKAMGCLGCCIKEEIKRWRTYVPSAISFLSLLRIFINVINEPRQNAKWGKWATVLSYYVILSGLTAAEMTYQAFPDDLRTSVYTKSSAVVYIQKKIYEMTGSDSKESWVNEAMLILNIDRPNETNEEVFSRPFSLANPFFSQS